MNSQARSGPQHQANKLSTAAVATVHTSHSQGVRAMGIQRKVNSIPTIGRSRHHQQMPHPEHESAGKAEDAEPGPPSQLLINPYANGPWHHHLQGDGQSTREPQVGDGEGRRGRGGLLAVQRVFGLPIDRKSPSSNDLHHTGGNRFTAAIGPKSLRASNLSQRKWSVNGPGRGIREKFHK